VPTVKLTIGQSNGHEWAQMTSESVCWLLQRQLKTPPERGFRGADERARTVDLLHGKQTLYQLSYIRERVRV
jgi:hypothetical protein